LVCPACHKLLPLYFTQLLFWVAACKTHFLSNYIHVKLLHSLENEHFQKLKT
jgi:hypothetical protein